MEYRKENHYIVAYQGGIFKGKWDILTNQYVGIRGGVLKGKSPAFRWDCLGSMSDVFRTAYTVVEEYYDKREPHNLERGQRLEEIISVGLCVNIDWRTWKDLDKDKTKLTKECVQFIKDNYRGFYSCVAIRAYDVEIKYKDFFAKCGGQDKWAKEVLTTVKSDIPHDFVTGMILRGIHEKVYTMHTGISFGHLVNTWNEMIALLGDKLEVKHNILTNYAILKWIYEEYQETHYDDILRAKNDKPWLYFEDDKYIVRPLLSRDDFHKEAESQHNCVERMYMERVFAGITHVVAVRKKKSPNKSFITCEVENNGRISQYYYRQNRIVDNADDLQFKQLYQEHLYSSIEE